MAKIKKIISGVEEDMEGLELSYTADGNAEWYRHIEK